MSVKRGLGPNYSDSDGQDLAKSVDELLCKGLRICLTTSGIYSACRAVRAVRALRLQYPSKHSLDIWCVPSVSKVPPYHGYDYQLELLPIEPSSSTPGTPK
jgi:hypothetical protein